MEPFKEDNERMWSQVKMYWDMVRGINEEKYQLSEKYNGLRERVEVLQLK